MPANIWGRTDVRVLEKKTKKKQKTLICFCSVSSAETQNKYEMLMSCFSFIFDWLQNRTEPPSFISLFVLPHAGNKTSDWFKHIQHLWYKLSVPQLCRFLDVVHHLTEGCYLLQRASHSARHAICKRHEAHAFTCLPDRTDLTTVERSVRRSASRPHCASCYQRGARRHSSCFNSPPYVPLDPSQLTWSEPSPSCFCFDFFFGLFLPSWAYFLLCLFLFSL